MDDLKKQYLNELRKSDVTDLDTKNSLRVLETFNLALKTFEPKKNNTKTGGITNAGPFPSVLN